MNLLREEYCKEIDVPMGLDNIYDYCVWLEKKHKKDVIIAFKNGQYNSYPETKSKLISGEEYYEKEFLNK